MVFEESKVAELPGVRGRKGADKQEAVLRPKAVQEAIGELLTSYEKSVSAADRFNSMVKAIAEKSGFMASNIKRLVKARHGEAFEDRRRDAEQLTMLFDEVGLKGGK